MVEENGPRETVIFRFFFFFGGGGGGGDVRNGKKGRLLIYLRVCDVRTYVCIHAYI